MYERITESEREKIRRNKYSFVTPKTHKKKKIKL